MASKIPVVYRESPPNTITIGAYDAIEGITKQIFYLCNQKTSGATTYILTQNTPYSNDVLLSGSWSGAFENVWDVDFDLKFNTAKVIKGTAVLNIPSRIFSGGTPGVYLFNILRKVKNGVETDIVTAESQQLDAADAVRTFNIPMVIPKTKIGAGETLRLTTIMQSSQGTGVVNMGIDPKNRSYGSQMQVGSTIDTTTSTIEIPFEVPLL